MAALDDKTDGKPVGAVLGLLMKSKGGKGSPGSMGSMKSGGDPDSDSDPGEMEGDFKEAASDVFDDSLSNDDRIAALYRAIHACQG